MNIVAVDPQARVLSEGEILALLKEPIPMRLSMVDGHGWPLVMPVWHVFEGDVFRVAAGKSSHKVRCCAQIRVLTSPWILGARMNKLVGCEDALPYESSTATSA